MRRLIGALVAGLISVSGQAQAVTQHFEVTLDRVYGGAGLLAELGIPFGGSATIRFSLSDTNPTTPTGVVSGPQFSYDYSRSHYESLSLHGSGGSVDAVASNTLNHRLYARDGIADGTDNVYDLIQVDSFLNSQQPTSYVRFFVLAGDPDESTWSRGTPITADLLNSMRRKRFYFSKYIGVGSGDATAFRWITSASLTFKEVSVVPLPASLPLFAAALGLFPLLRRRRRP